MGVLFKIALRYLVSRKTHNAVNIISIISVLGVVITTAALVCVLSVFNGFRGLIMSRLAILDPQVSITATLGKTIADADSVLAVARAVPGVELAQPVVSDNALAIFAEYQMPVRIKGVPKDYNRLTDVDSVIVDGQWMLQDPITAYAVVGVGPALRLHVRPEYPVMLKLYAPQRQGHVNLANPMGAFTADSLFVSGIFQLQQNAYDNDLIYVPIAMARRLLDYDREATAVELRLAAGADEAQVMARLRQQLGSSYTIKNRLMQQAEAYRMVNIEKWMAFLLMAFIMVIATFNVVSTLSLLIIEKDESIATLRNLGATNSQLTRIFVVVGWLIALAGAVLGITLGVLLCMGQQHFGWLKLGGDPANMIVHAYPVAVVWTDLLVVALLVAAIGAVTSLVTTLIMRRRLAA
ncbi:MAG: ABC transporter permease [Muribaculaceae bacterium]|nr:ABC transporter permease [Muribaculaceae bacterium]